MYTRIGIAALLSFVCLGCPKDRPKSSSDNDGGSAQAGASGEAGKSGSGGGGSGAGAGGTSADAGKDCKRGGCSSQLCLDADAEDLATDCEFRPEYACYQEAECAVQADGHCDFTPSKELDTCLANAADGGTATGLMWYETCGAPVCKTTPMDDPNVANCTTETAGGSCGTRDVECDLANECGTKLRCTDQDPTMQVGGCPISRARYKRDIAYLDGAQRERVYRDLLEIPLASYTYKTDASQTPQLGFIIEDVEPSPATRGDHVNLYGYLSMAVNAVQLQAAKIDALERELAELRERAHASEPLVCEP